jgi:hypothetical protein
VWTPPRPQGEFLGEGDTFTYLNVLASGLRAYEDETPGGWAGRDLTTTAFQGAGQFGRRSRHSSRRCASARGSTRTPDEA